MVLFRRGDLVSRAPGLAVRRCRLFRTQTIAFFPASAANTGPDGKSDRRGIPGRTQRV